MKSTDEVISKLLLDVYEAAANPAHWETALCSFANQMMATKASIHVHAFSSMIGGAHIRGKRAYQIGYDEIASREYAAYYAIRDPYIHRIQERFPREGTGTNADLMTESEFRRNEFYNDYFRRNEIFHLCWTIIERNESFSSGLSLIRPEDAKSFNAEQVNLLRLLTPHLRKALRLQRIIEKTASDKEVFLQSYAQFDFGVIALDEFLRVNNLSAPAKHLLDQQDGLRIKAGRLEAMVPSENHQLQAMLVAASQIRKGSLQLSSSALLLTRSSGRKPFQLALLPFSSCGPLGEGHHQILVFLSDPSAKPASRELILRTLYGLTPAEARLANLLLQGHDVRSAASELRITIETARFNLKRVLAKTDTRRQAELMRLMLSLPGSS